MNYNIVFLIILFRIITDFIWYNDKPVWNVSIYTCLILVFILGNSQKIISNKKRLYIVLFLFFPVASSFINSYFDSFLSTQVNENLKTYLPTVFLYVASVSCIDFNRLRLQLKRFLFPLIILGLVYLNYHYKISLNKMYSFFLNEPNHVFSQTISKIFFIYMSEIIIATCILLIVYIINVRSNIFPIFLHTYLLF